MKSAARERATMSEAARVASREWGTCSVYVRGELRAMGVKGELRRLDEYASGKRGAGALKFLADFAQFCKARGLPKEKAALHVASAAERVVISAYDDDAA